MLLISSAGAAREARAVSARTAAGPRPLRPGYHGVVSAIRYRRGNPMELFQLQGKVALVTGGNSGLGLAMARGLAQAGATVVILGRREERNDAAVAAFAAEGLRAHAIGADVTEPAQVQSAVDEVGARLGGLDILVANAGSNRRKAPQDYALDEWRALIELNLTSVFTSCQAAYPALMRRGGGKIVTIGSMASLFGFDMAAAYAAAKGGVVQLTHSLAMAWAADRIQVNCILPGWIDTELTTGARAQVPGLNERVLARTPAGRWGQPDELVGAAIFLCSRASDFVTGVALPVDGGFSSAVY